MNSKNPISYSHAKLISLVQQQLQLDPLPPCIIHLLSNLDVAIVWYIYDMLENIFIFFDTPTNNNQIKYEKNKEKYNKIKELAIHDTIIYTIFLNYYMSNIAINTEAKRMFYSTICETDRSLAEDIYIFLQNIPKDDSRYVKVEGIKFYLDYKLIKENSDSGYLVKPALH